MRESKKRCNFCRCWYLPDPRTYREQISCNKAGCKKKRKERANRNWNSKHPGYFRDRGVKVRSWALDYPDYWKQYRRKNAAYREREKRRMRIRRLRLKGVAKQDTIREMSVEKLQSIQSIVPESVAKQDVIYRRVDEIISYLFWKERVAKQDGMVIGISG